ncbi:MAG TPA: hypothetical protein VNX21_01950 [Candidatus Thermoplasmatota archaeon]|nr:hypothetical protein [Candidatus Thermoplasmatota archaeon]
MHATFTPHRAPGAERIHAIDRRLHELQRELARATVLLGLGKLQPEGYAACAAPLKAERATLEVERVRLMRNA